MKHCVTCHFEGGDGYHKTGRRLNSYAEIKRGSGGVGGILTPGNCNKSKPAVLIRPNPDV